MAHDLEGSPDRQGPEPRPTPPPLGPQGWETPRWELVARVGRGVPERGTGNGLDSHPFIGKTLLAGDEDFHNGALARGAEWAGVHAFVATGA